jgi:4-hydroxybenzoate polyprenyltransferase
MSRTALMAIATSNPVGTSAPTSPSVLGGLVESLRPSQWVKNGFVLCALMFSRSLTDWHRAALVTLAAIVFCAVSSATYLVNDVLDAPDDRQHPLKRLRPVASGRVSKKAALWTAGVLGFAALAGAWTIDHTLFQVVSVYAAISLVYSAWLKRVMLVDVFVIAAGFILRVIGGGVVIHVELSAWLVVCTTLLALFLALSKRRHELVLLGENASGHRSTLADYTPHFLDQLIGIVTASTVMSYALYTLSDDVRTKFPNKRLELTVPLVLFGIFRYLYLVHRRNGGGNPARMLFTDPVLLASVMLWAAAVIAIIYL